jgi:serine/threonine protein kinase
MGQAVHVPHDSATGRLVQVRHTGPSGTYKTMAPELCEAPAPASLDLVKTEVWSVGVVLMMLLVGRFPPWDAPYVADSSFTDFLLGGARAYVDCHRALLCAPVSAPTLDLLDGLLARDPSHRLTLEQIMEHPAMLRVTQEDVAVAKGACDGPTGEIEVDLESSLMSVPMGT